MSAKIGMETGHLKCHIEAGRLALLQEMAMRVCVESGESFRHRALHPPVRNFLRKSLTAPFEVGPGLVFIERDSDEQTEKGIRQLESGLDR